MEVTLVHPDAEGKVIVTNQIQYDAFKARGFVDAPVKESKKDEAAETPGLQAKPDADASKSAPAKGEADMTADVDKKNARRSNK